MQSLRMLCLGATALVMLAAAPSGHAAPAAAAGFSESNPFAQPSTLPYQAPPFDRIKDSDYEPATIEGMRQQIAEMDAIANDPASPTFENTIAAMEKTGRLLDRVQLAFLGVVGANTNDTLDKVQTDTAPLLAAHQDAIFLNPKLFARVKTIYDARDHLHLDPESQQLLKIYYMQFVHAGALLNDADKAKLKELNKRDATLETAFQQKLLAAAKDGALVLNDKAALAGLSDQEIAAAAEAAKARKLDGKFLIPLQNTTQQPSLTSLTDRTTREKLFNESWTRAEKGDKNDTRDTISELAQIRAQKAKLLGYPNYAAYVLYDQMADTPEKVLKFMGQMVTPVAAKSAGEARDVQGMIDKSGEHFKVKPWDWEHYSEQVRKARYDIDENEVKPYFELNNVLENGVFYAANKLYGVTFKERKNIPVYHPDIRVFEVFDFDGAPIGLVYFDYFKRDNKSGGAWMSIFMEQSKINGTHPVVYNVANFTKPAPGQPALLTFDDVTTMFHEFGHGLHGLFANETYPTISGTSVARDFVEFPSQFNEHWALYPEVLKHYARNYRTGKPMPPALIDKLKNAAKFNQGYKLGEVIAAAELDMKWHMLSPDAPRQDVDTFETEALKAAHVDFPFVPPRYRSSYFLHIWANGYAAGYYAYLWTEMLDDDAFAWFKAHGGLTRANGQRFRDMILSKGHTEDYGPMFRAFYGKDPDIGPMLQHRGLIPGGD